MTIAISFGKYGGFYWYNGYTWRLCLGWMAITYLPEDLDLLLDPQHNKETENDDQ